MPAADKDLAAEVDRLLQDRFTKGSKHVHRVPSTAMEPRKSEQVNALVLPDDQRGRMPYTQDKYLIQENPHLVAWERELRKFLVKLSPRHGHRVSAVMVYEWATGINYVESLEQGGNPNPDVRKINSLLKSYFGKPYSTYIMGRKVKNCYKVPPGYYITRHRPKTLTLYWEYQQKVLWP